MGLGKATGSTRINRYEQQSSAGSFDSLGELAEALQVPPAYLLADSAPMADAILELGKADDLQQAKLAIMLPFRAPFIGDRRIAMSGQLPIVGGPFGPWTLGRGFNGFTIAGRWRTNAVAA